MRPRCPQITLQISLKGPIDLLVLLELSVLICMKAGLHFCMKQAECLSINHNQPLQILDWTFETGAQIFLSTKNPFPTLGY